MTEVVVHFATRPDGGRKLRAISGEDVKAVVIGKEAQREFIAAIKRIDPDIRIDKRRIPKEVTLKDGDAVVPRLRGGERGPEDICYWVPGAFICWREE